MTDEQIIERCKAAGIKWIPPQEDEDDSGAFPGSFDMVSMAEMRALLSASIADTAGAKLTAEDVERQYQDGVHIGSGLPRATCPCGFCAKHRHGFNQGSEPQREMTANERWAHHPLIPLSAYSNAAPPAPSVADAADVPVSAFQTLKAALQADADYAWSWHCNLAVPIMDSIRCTPEQANKAGADLMQYLFGIDVRKFPEWRND